MKKRAIVLLLLCIGVLFCACSSEGLPSDVPLRVYFLDVGQGDCILIRTREGDILIDSGPESEQGRLCMRLASLGVKELRLAVFTHPDEDHIGGADGILSQFPTREIWMSQPERADPNESEHILWSAAEACGAEILTVSEGKLWRLGDALLYVLAPSAIAAEDPNESSVVLKLTCGEATAIFTGDVGAEGERALVEKYGAHLSCQLYKAGHHGSSTSSSADFLRAMSPTWAIISCEAGNAYGHPHGETLLRLAEVGATVCRTDLSGDVIFDCDGAVFIPINE
ncbi:MAG: MBL fold metallo-hydrolase [Clostridia bacterium]|nr:MBL fold metallo-hydrolase [Clostridia bacterium]